MPFDPNYPYAGIDPVSHASVAPNGRRTITADYAILYIQGASVGMVQRFSPSESRPVAPQYEIGNVYPVEFIPQPWSGRIQVGRLEIFKNQLYNAFGFNTFGYQTTNDTGLGGNTPGTLSPNPPYWPTDKLDSQTSLPIITTLADIQWPLDMSIHIQMPINAGGIYVKNYVECWITEYSTSYDAGAKVVAENVSFTYRNVTMQTISLASLNNSTNALGENLGTSAV